MATYQAILNSEIDPDSPITTSLMTRLRDNPEAVREGDATAPRDQYASRLFGGTGRDGALVALPTNDGIWDATSLTFNAAGSLPSVTLIRVLGDVNLNGATITVPTYGDITTQSSGGQPGRVVSAGGVSLLTGASYGDAGFGPGGMGNARDAWRVARLTAPGAGQGDSFVRAGALVIQAEGNVDLTGATITFTAPNANGTGFVAYGGGGGIVKVYANGQLTLTGCTINVVGGNGTGSATTRYGGGGGYAGLCGTTVVGAATVNAGGGTGADGNGDAGLGESVVLTREEMKAVVGCQ